MIKHARAGGPSSGLSRERGGGGKGGRKTERQTDRETERERERERERLGFGLKMQVLLIHKPRQN